MNTLLDEATQMATNNRPAAGSSALI